MGNEDGRLLGEGEVEEYVDDEELLEEGEEDEGGKRGEEEGIREDVDGEEELDDDGYVDVWFVFVVGVVGILFIEKDVF